MNWEVGIDMYTLICIKLMTNKNLLYKKIKTKKKKKEWLVPKKRQEITNVGEYVEKREPSYTVGGTVN